MKFLLFFATFILAFVITLVFRLGQGFANESALRPPALLPVGADVNDGESELEELTLKVHWGGFYATKGVGEKDFSVFRLIDINPGFYHAAIYEETFPELPTFEEVRFLQPEKHHESRPAIELLKIAPVYIGHKALYETDVIEYGGFLLRRGYSELQTRKELGRVIYASWDEPLFTQLSNNKGLLKLDSLVAR